LGLSSIISCARCRLKAGQARRRPLGMAVPFPRLATQPGPLSGTTRRAGPAVPQGCVARSLFGM